MDAGHLLLIPTPLGAQAPVDSVPEAARRAPGEVDLLLVENERTARRYLARAGSGGLREGVEVRELSEHTRPEELEQYVAAMEQGRRVGVVSEAGCPGVADPGAELARRCHERGIRVIALPGPSSVLMALMASGLGGQRFVFHGYLPVKPDERVRRIREIERRARSAGETQLFIETPYRNERLFADILAACEGDTLLCLAVELTTPAEWVRTQPVGAWKQGPSPDLRKRPTVFLLGR